MVHVLLRDLFATLVSAALAHTLVKSLEFLAAHGQLSQFVCRKTVHITTGPLFVLTWPLFSAGSYARLWAASVPFINMVRLALVGVGALRSEATIKAVSRGGHRQELLTGPLLYIAVVIAVTLQFWRQSPIGFLTLCMMCVGDGLADIAGRRYGRSKLPFNTSKTWTGSVAMLTGGALMSTAYIALFSWMGYYKIDMQSMVPVIWTAAFAATLVEGLPIYRSIDDNLTVPIAAALSGELMMWLLSVTLSS